ncbi:DUF3383 family protein [Salmonella enterica subsp. enterica serovar Abaetetuba]|uniref:DUF3383 family protein n=1 Tax=Salmonella enterica subsp. enterica serovar Abaetetuba str. ATCC 35640 TaxID=1208611 RepID=A0AAU7YG66_SALET|nr:DUF3383 family protein [Salmonella enterica]EBD1323989.1 DUF3383 domain-containing protein [Salmonella enterica subsp. enterica]ECV2753122.1 DUF3383 family protein [Salmonella enterica subsp. enterica serovar Abaetetuba]EEL6099944.1 DUF3383 family protein [Salmonella enterica subsp. enterica serovar Infantis]QUZ09869.1 DUF3383 family protein [Salmonella enterica subsp. enterica serovar Newport str. WA_14882]AHW19476.1 hypothetical protein CFSAN000658_13590 [Salmonella enterica subsp. enteri
MAKGLPLNRVTNVTVTLSARAAQGRNFGSMLILGNSTVIPITERLRLYSDPADIGDDFGVDSEEYKAAVVWFSQSPRPTQLYVGRWIDSLTSAESGPTETLLQAVNALLDYNSWYGLHLAVPVADYPDDADLISVSSAIESATVSRILAITSSEADILSSAVETDLATKLKAAKYSRTYIQYSSTSPYAALSAFGRAFTVNFTGSNTTITLKFKQLPGITYETIGTSQANALEAKNCNVYVYYENDTAILEQGVMCNGDFFDERHGLDWLQNAVQTADYNTLYTSTTKIPQIDAGTTTRIANIEKVLDVADKSGLFAPGIWTGGPMGQLGTGDTLTKGYYTWADTVDNQLQTDREARKGVPIQVAAKLAGAVHYGDVAITVVR